MMTEYQRMVAAGERHWWYQSTRALLEQLVVPASARSRRRHCVPRCRRRIGRNGFVAGRRSDDGARRLRSRWRLQAAVAGSRRIPRRACRLNHPPHPDAAFDAVLCVTALYHRMNPDPQRVVDEFARVTKPGGLVCLMEPGGKRLWRGHDEVTHAARRFSLADMRSMVRVAGLELVRARQAPTRSWCRRPRSWA